MDVFHRLQLHRLGGIPALVRRKLRGRPADGASPASFFTTYYRDRWWPGRESRSGPGSEGAFGDEKVALLLELQAEFGLHAVLDVGCGDLWWMRRLLPRWRTYHGVDVVEPLIRRNRRAHGSGTVTFDRLDLTDPGDQERVPKQAFDLVVCFDVLGHLLNDELDRLLAFLFGTDLQARYVLLTSRRDADSRAFLRRPKSRHEGIDAAAHPELARRGLRPVWERAALYEGDFFELYERRES